MIIKNKSKLIKNAKTKKIKKLRRDVLDSLEVAVRAVDPYHLVKNNLKLKNGKLLVGGRLNLDLKKFKNVYVLGAGKAVFAMAKGMETVLGRKISCGFVNVQEIPKSQSLKFIKPTVASHPIPNSAGVLGAKKILSLAKKAVARDLIFVLISGGGSALLPLPAPGITLEDKIKINQMLVRSKAEIKEINTVRKHISAIKGGQLAKAIYPATAVCFYLSDVVGDDLSFIASGPCVPDDTSFLQAIKVLKKYKLWGKTPGNIQNHLLLGKKNKKLETPYRNDPIFTKRKFHHFILGSNKVALTAAAQELKKHKYYCQILTDKLQGEIHYLAKKFAVLAEKILKTAKRPIIILAGGETTLDLKGKGMGGRNQELVMVFAPKNPLGCVFASFNTDGVDGRSAVPVAGGICDQWTYGRGLKLGLKIEKFIANNDSYHYLNKLGETIITGKTGTNVGDIVALGILNSCPERSRGIKS